MFEISQLKEMKLPELQEMAKKLKVPKYRSMKKLDLVYQILDYQARLKNQKDNVYSVQKVNQSKSQKMLKKKLILKLKMTLKKLTTL